MDSPSSVKYYLTRDWLQLLSTCAGYGVFAKDDIKAGEFLLEYSGDLVSCEDADCSDDQTYIYYFTVGSKHYRFANFASDSCSNLYSI